MMTLIKSGYYSEVSFKTVKKYLKTRGLLANL